MASDCATGLTGRMAIRLAHYEIVGKYCLGLEIDDARL